MTFIIFDGDCNFCNRSILFFAKRDTNNTLKFTRSTSEFGKKLLAKHRIMGLEKSTLIMLKKNNVFIKSDAVRKILLELPNYKILGVVMCIIPKKVSNWFYDVFSKYRNSVPLPNSCELPDIEIRNKFID